MSSYSVPVVNPLPIKEGETHFQDKINKVQAELSKKIPLDLILPADIISNPPLDVTSIPSKCGLLTEDEISITENYEVVALAEAIATQKLSAVKVARAFCRRAALAHQLSNCLVDLRIDEALQRAQELDDHLAKTGQVVGPLHGVPISLKEMIPVKGYGTSFGFFATWTNSCEYDCLLVEILRNAGAVFYCKTNQPQGVFGAECASFHGRTVNPHNIRLAPGGSSGGEAALQALRGSILGVGTDIGGSIRIPAAFCGIYGFKPGSGLLPIKDMVKVPIAASININIIAGPMSTSLAGIDLLCRAVQAADATVLDPTTVPVQYNGLSLRSSDSPQKLKIGIYTNDGLALPHPPILRALEWARDSLTRSGFTVKSYTLPLASEIKTFINDALVAVAGIGTPEALAAVGEPMQPMLANLLSNDTDTQNTPIDIVAVAEHKYRLEDIRQKFIADWVAQGDFDVVIGPAWSSCATVHETAGTPEYTQIWNVLDWPAIVVPTPLKTNVNTGGKERYPENLRVLGEMDKDNRRLWEENDYTGSPVALQVATRRFRDGELIAALGAMSDALK